MWFIFTIGRRACDIVNEAGVGEIVQSVRLPATAGSIWPLRQLLARDRERTVVLGLSAECAVCSEQLPFYRQLLAVSRVAGTPFEVSILLDKSPGDDKFLESLGHVHSPVRRASLRDLGVRHTPTVWVVAKDGRVVSVDVGRLSKVRQGTIAGLADGALRADPKSAADREAPTFELSEEMLRNIPEAAKLQVLDVRPRDAFALEHRRGATNIPLDELGTRASEELETNAPIVIDCTFTDMNYCDIAAFRLGRLGFSRVHALNRGRVPAASCETSQAPVRR